MRETTHQRQTGGMIKDFLNGVNGRKKLDSNWGLYVRNQNVIQEELGAFLEVKSAQKLGCERKK